MFELDIASLFNDINSDLKSYFVKQLPLKEKIRMKSLQIKEKNMEDIQKFALEYRSKCANQ